MTAPDYSSLSDDEVLRLATRPQDLTDEARSLLDAELSQRNLNAHDVETCRAVVTEFERSEALKVAVPFTTRGMGRKFFGKSNYQYDSISNSEEFDTTLWFVLLMFPLIPLGTYRIRRRRRENWWDRLFADNKFEVSEKLSRNWQQIALTWLKAVLVVIGIRLSLPLLLEWSFRFSNRN